MISCPFLRIMQRGLRKSIYIFVLTYSLSFLALSQNMFAQAPSSPEALQPLRPGGKVKTELRSSPSDTAPVLRRLRRSDQIQILRSEGLWYEVDVRSKEGIEYRGWVKGPPPKERTAPELPPATAKLEKRNRKALGEGKARWFWLGNMNDPGSISLAAGYQSLKYLVNGLRDINGEQVRSAAPGFDFGGFDIGTKIDFGVFETDFGSSEFRWSVHLRYNFGRYGVKFGTNALQIPDDLEGASYTIITHNLKVENRTSYEFTNWQTGFFRGVAGLGLFYLESAPDLRETSSGIVFTQLGMSGILTRLGLEAQFSEKYRMGVGAASVFLSNYSEAPQAAGTSQFEDKNFPLIFDGEFRAFFAEHWAGFLSGEYFTTKLKQSGDTARLGVAFSDLNADYSYLRVVAGLGYHF